MDTSGHSGVSGRLSRNDAPNQGDEKVSTDKQPETTVKVEKRVNGKWCFVIKFRGVTYPAQGNFTSALQAQAAAQSVLTTLERQR